MPLEDRPVGIRVLHMELQDVMPQGNGRFKLSELASDDGYMHVLAGYGLNANGHRVTFELYLHGDADVAFGADNSYTNEKEEFADVE